MTASGAVSEVGEGKGDVGGDPDDVALDAGGLGEDAGLAELADDVVGCGLPKPVDVISLATSTFCRSGLSQETSLMGSAGRECEVWGYA